MKEMPANQLDPRVKNVWRLSDLVGVLLCALCIIGPTIPFATIPNFQPFGRFLLIIELIVLVVVLVLVLVVLPPIRYARWRYEVSPEYLDIAKGIIWRKRYTIPFIRVQNTDTRQGPILRAFGLASVTVSTAATAHEIPGLSFAEAEQLRDRAAELARLAREDV